MLLEEGVKDKQLLSPLIFIPVRGTLLVKKILLFLIKQLFSCMFNIKRVLGHSLKDLDCAVKVHIPRRMFPGDFFL